MNTSRCIFKLLYPCTVNSVFFAVFDVFFDSPLEFFKLLRIKQLPCIVQRYFVVFRKSLLPVRYICFNIAYGLIVLAFKVLNVFIAGI